VRIHGGFGLISILVVVLILGVLSSQALTSSTPSIVTTTTSNEHGSKQPTTTLANSDVLAARRACDSDATTLITAMQAYQAQFYPNRLGLESGITPGQPATYPAGVDAQTLLNDGFINSWPTSAHYAISVSVSQPLDVSIYVPATSSVAMSYSSQSSNTGCNAIR
jgi:hypothetical protein